jgi:hypothetical protein
MTKTRDCLLLSMLTEAVADRADPLPLLALSDYLTELGPGSVTHNRIPEWLRRSWRHARKGTRRLSDEWSVIRDMDGWLNGEGYKSGCYWGLDHHGMTLVGGVVCFVSEPYATLETARLQAMCLADKVMCIGVGLAESRWGKGTVRVLLLPALMEI